MDLRRPRFDIKNSCNLFDVMLSSIYHNEHIWEVWQF